jgi:hypothetical protein
VDRVRRAELERRPRDADERGRQQQPGLADGPVQLRPAAQPLARGQREPVDRDRTARHRGDRDLAGLAVVPAGRHARARPGEAEGGQLVTFAADEQRYVGAVRVGDR